MEKQLDAVIKQLLLDITSKGLEAHRIESIANAINTLMTAKNTLRVMTATTP